MLPGKPGLLLIQAACHGISCDSLSKPKNTGEGSLSLLQHIFLIQESNQGLLHCGKILYQLSYHGSLYVGRKDQRSTEHSHGSHCYGGVSITSAPWLLPHLSLRERNLSPGMKRHLSSHWLCQNSWLVPHSCWCLWVGEESLGPSGKRKLPWPLIFSRDPSGFIVCECCLFY